MHSKSEDNDGRLNTERHQVETFYGLDKLFHSQHQQKISQLSNLILLYFSHLQIVRDEQSSYFRQLQFYSRMQLVDPRVIETVSLTL